VNTSIKNGPAPSSEPPTITPLAPDHKGTASYVSKIDKDNPGYIRRLFRYSQKIKGALATFTELALSMNIKSQTNINQPTTNLSRRQLNNWFTDQGGKEFAPTTKPLDEKWFYTTNRRRKVKRLPRGEDEEEGVDFIPQPKVRSRRFPVKAMFMGVVGRPIPEKQFDGKIHMERGVKRRWLNH